MQERKADSMAQTVKQVQTAKGVHGLLASIVFAAIIVVIALFTIFLGAKWYIPAIMFFVAAAVVLLSVVSLKRTSKVNLDTLNEPEPENVALEQGEAVAHVIPAVMRYLVARSTEYMGAGKVHHPENALIVTNKAVWALTVPLAGVDKVVSGQDIGKLQWMLSYKDISDKLQEMLTSLSLEEVFSQGRAKRLMGLEELREAKTRPLSQDIRLVRSDGKTFRYSIRVKEDYLKAKEIFNIS